MAFILTRIDVGDYDRWKPMFDQDTPGTRSAAKGHRILRNVDKPGEVFVIVEFDTAEQAKAAGRSCSPRVSSTAFRTSQSR